MSAQLLAAVRLTQQPAQRRIALVTNLPTHYRKPLFDRLAAAYDVDFFFTGAGAGRYWPREHRLSTEGLSVVDSAGARALSGALRRGGYDCVVCSLTGRLSLLAATRATRAAGVPLVLWVGIWHHPQTLVHRVSRPFARRLYREASAILVYGRHVAAHVAAESGRTHSIFEAYQAVDNAFFGRRVPATEVERVRQELGLPAGAALLYVGRLEPEKGLEALLDSFADVRAARSLVLVGTGSIEAALRKRADRLGVAHRLFFPGYVAQEELRPYYHAAEALVLPSVTTRRFKEPWGLVVNEAMNCGLPVVATDAVGAVAGGLVVDGVTGLVVPEGDVPSLTRALDAMCADRVMRGRLSRTAREHVRRWSHDAAAASFEAAIEAACAS